MIGKSKLILLATLAYLPNAFASDKALPDHAIYRTVAEKALEIPITQAGSASQQRRVIYSLGPMDIGWRFNGRFQAGLTKRCAGIVHLTYYMVRAKSADATDGTLMSPYTVKDLQARPSAPENLPLHPDEGINHSVSQAFTSSRRYSDPIIEDIHLNVVMLAESHDSSCIGQALQVKGSDANGRHGELIAQY